VLVILAARHNAGKRQIEETRRFITYCLDHTVASATKDADKFVVLFDLTGQYCAKGLWRCVVQPLLCAADHPCIGAAWSTVRRCAVPCVPQGLA
jgi:hypothetical protein